MKTIKKLLSLILVTSMFLCQNSVLAIGISDIVDDVVGDEPFIVSEDVSRRGEFEKHYLCSDGTFVAVTYPEAVHYQAEDGNWVDVDNEAKYNTSVQRYVTSNNAFKVELASVTNTENLVTLRSNGHTLSWGLNTDKQTVETVLPVKGIGALIKTEETAEVSLRVKSLDSEAVSGKKYITDDRSFALSKASGGITYENVVAGAPEISVDYSVFHNKIEEDIYINSKTDINSISMNVTTNGLVAVKNANGSVSFVDKNGEEQYRVGIPYMVDASDEVLNDIEVTVEQNGNDCVITYTPDEHWFHSDERVYPILLDPSITTNDYASSIIDTYVFQGNKIVHSSEQMTFVGIKKSKVYRSFFKFVNLPTIDSSMPIIGATFTLTHTSGTTTGKTVGLYKLRSDWIHDNITFGNQPPTTESDRICTCAYSSSNKYVLDLTSDIANLYSDILAGTNYGYMLRYEDESLTNPDYNTTYSTEYATASVRPTLKITYGYSLPSGLINGGVYAFQSYASISYLSVGGSDVNKTNVIVKQTATADLTSAQQFKLEYVSSNGAYRLRAMSSSGGNGRVLDIVKSGGYVKNGCNVQIYDPTDAMANEWFIVGVGTTTFKIIPRTNMSLALTAAPGANGSSSGTSSTSVGNVFVATFDGSNDYQKWNVRDMSTGSLVSPGMAGSVASGVYYLNNRETGKYLYKTASSTAGGQSGLIADLGSSIRWQITHVANDKYTIQSTEDPTLFLKAESGASAPTLSALPASNEISDNYLWKILTASGGGTRIRNVATEQYLKSGGTTNSLEATLPSSSTNDYDYFVWRLAKSDRVLQGGELQDCEIFHCRVIYQENHTIKLKGNDNALWIKNSDFVWMPDSTVSISADGVITGNLLGTAYVTALHKPTDQLYYFQVSVVRELCGDDLLMEEGPLKNSLATINRQIIEVQNSYDAEEISSENMNIMLEALQQQANIARADYIVAGNHPTSSYAYAVLGGTPNSGYPFSSEISYNETNPESGLHVIVIQRALEVLGYYEPGLGGYGTYDADTQVAAESYPNLLTNGVFNALSFGRIFNSDTYDQRSFDALSQLNKLRVIHNKVAETVALKVGGTATMRKNKIKNGSENGKHYGYADVLKDTGSKTYIWEVKPDKEIYYNGKDSIGVKQVERYIKAAEPPQDFTTPLVYGYSVGAFYFKYLTMDIYVRTPTTSNNALVLYGTKANDQSVYVKEECPEFVPEPEYVHEFSTLYLVDLGGSILVTVFGLAVYAGALFIAYTMHTGEISFARISAGV